MRLTVDNAGARGQRARVDIEVILDATEAGAPGLRELARRFLEAGTRHLGVRSMRPA